MTKHPDVNKCRRQEKFKMAALKRRGKETENKNTFETKMEANNVREKRDKGWIHIIRVHDTTQLAVTTTRQGNRRSRNTPHKERMRGLVKYRDHLLFPPPLPTPPPPPPPPPHSYIVNDRYNSRNKRASQEKENSEWQEPVTSSTPNANSRRPRNR